MQGLTFYEFFAGGGMVRAGLSDGWTCLFANDFDSGKAAAYAANWGEGEMRCADIHALSSDDLPGVADLAWASFPCQDLSLAGAQAGLGGARSGAFFGFRDLIAGLRAQGRAPRLLALENVVGALSSNKGRDFHALCAALRDLGYACGALVVDAALFTPQSRPRLFVIALRADLEPPAGLTGAGPDAAFAPPALLRAHDSMPDDLKRAWRWWRLAAPAQTNARLVDLLERDPADVRWRSPDETRRLIDMMDSANRAKLDAALASGGLQVGALYRRTRKDAQGRKVQRAEVRFDGLAGCLRTPGGGSSRQFLLIVEGGEVRSRLLSGREAARLMGLPEDYALPARYSDAYHLLGDGVAPPVVRHLARSLFEPLLRRPLGQAAA
ncbi:MAG: DNA cytosine methyltransferase [Beijerinckiaceae bacterium]